MASFFVSRVDTEVDRRLPPDHPLRGLAVVANAWLADRLFRERFSGPRWEALAEQGARVQRPLWASTSTKNPAYSETLYVDTLIAPETVNTLAPPSMDALREMNPSALRPNTATEDAEGSSRLFAELAKSGVDMVDVTDTLEREGVEAFCTSHHDLLAVIAKRRDELARACNCSVAMFEAEAAADEALEILREYLRFDTTNPPGNEEPAARFLADVRESVGIHTELRSSAPGRMSLVARIEGRTDDRSTALALLNHIDVVPADPSEWSVDPFGAEERDGYLWGRGAIDMKGMGVMQLSTMLSLARSNAPLRRERRLHSGGRRGGRWPYGRRVSGAEAPGPDRLRGCPQRGGLWHVLQPAADVRLHAVGKGNPLGPPACPRNARSRFGSAGFIGTGH